MASDSDDSTSSHPVIQAVSELLPTKSAPQYEKRYEEFIQWKKNKKAASFSENLMLSYFQEISKRNGASSLWTIYSMLKSTLNIKNSIDISKYSKLKAFLKRKNEGYKTKKAKTFSLNEINKFIQDAPNKYYLFTKVVLIIGIMGACRRQELYNLQFNDVEVFPSTILVKIKNPNSKQVRSFTITGRYHEICLKYIRLRPTSSTNSAFFLYYKKGRCFDQKMGINNVGGLGKLIASYLKLPNPEQYTGHCFRRSSASLVVNADGDIISRKMLMSHGGLKSTSTEGYVVKADVSKLNMNTIGNKNMPHEDKFHGQNSVPQDTEFVEYIAIKNEIEEETESPISHSSQSLEVTIVKNELEEADPSKSANVIEDKQTNSDRAASLFTEEEYITIGKSIAIQLRGVERKQQTIALRLISDAIQHGNLGNLTAESAIALRPTNHASYRNPTGD